METIKQISIFAENKPGKIERITKVLAESKANILAISISSSDGFGVIKVVVDKSDLAYRNLKENGLTVSLNEVIGIGMKDKPGGLYDVAKILNKNKINVDNAYVFVKQSRQTAYLIIEVKEIEKSIEILKKEKLHLLQEKELTAE
jgi:hypothetical protein